MKTALIAGSTGLIGKNLLQVLLAGNRYDKVITLVRNPSAIKHDKLDEQVIDFNQINSFNANTVVNDVFCCLGTTIKTAGSQEAFTKVDYDYVLEIAKWAKINKCQLFSVVSSVGASSETSNFYLKTKGKMEASVQALDLPSVHIFRPSLLLGQRNEFRLGEKFSEKLMFLVNPLLKGKLRKYKAIKASAVARSMYNQAQTMIGGVVVFEGAEIK